MIKLSDTNVFAIVRAYLIEHRAVDKPRTSSLKIEHQNELTTLSIPHRSKRKQAKVQGKMNY